jgi:hypothetical protein
MLLAYHYKVEGLKKAELQKRERAEKMNSPLSVCTGRMPFDKIIVV